MHPIAICVPVRNEQDLLPGFLRACAALDTRGLDVTLCLYLDGCSDDSALLVERMRPAMPFAVAVRGGPVRADANAGRARAAAMATGVQVLGDAPHALLLSTDADSAPEPDWAQVTVRALAVADVAAGRLIRTDAAADPAQTRIEAYLDRLHGWRRTVDPVAWDAGGCHFGGAANLALRRDVYVALGGFRPLPSGEDAALLDDASRAGWRVRRDSAMRVHTSSRRVGRAPDGLAVALRDIAVHGLPRFDHPAASDWQYRMQALARRSFATLADPAVRERLGRAIGIDGDHVLGVGRDCPNAEAFCMRIVPAAPDAGMCVPLDVAEAALAALEHGAREQAA